MRSARARRGLRSRTRSIAAAASVALVVGLAGCSSDTTPTIDLPEQASGSLPGDTVEQMSAAVENAMSAAAASGAIVGVWVPWSGSWVTAEGTDADGDPVTTDMVFRAGTVTRAMTCDILYEVAAEGTVSLDDPVAEHVRAYPTLTDVTLRHLCDGTSGARSFADTLHAEWIRNPDRRWNPLELTGYGFGAGDPATPGVAYDGSDAGYVLLGMALSNATGLSQQAMIEHYITTPLSLSSTRLPTAPAAMPGDAFPAPGLPSLHGYEARRDGGNPVCDEVRDVSERSASFGSTDAGVVSTVEDLGRYTQALATGALFDGEDDGRWSAALPPRADAPSWFTVGGGAYQAGSLVGQYSSVPGYLVAAFADTGTGLTVVAVLNNSTANAELVGSLAWELAAIASMAPPADGFEDPNFGVPWTQAQFSEAVSAAAVCQ